MSETEGAHARTQISNQCPGIKYSEKAIEALFQALDQKGSFDAPSGELSFAFVTKEEIARIHGEFMNDPTPTDVITFPGDPEHRVAGDICVSPEVALEYAKANQLDFSEELTLYLVHGYLHLAGFDDIEDEDRKEMRKAEQVAMNLAKSLQIVPEFELEPSR